MKLSKIVVTRLRISPGDYDTSDTQYPGIVTTRPGNVQSTNGYVMLDRQEAFWRCRAVCLPPIRSLQVETIYKPAGPFRIGNYVPRAGTTRGCET